MLLENVDKLNYKDKDFIKYLARNFPNYDNEWLYDVLYSIAKKEKLIDE